MSAKTMTVAGIMSGTSADGIDVAIVRIAAGKRRPMLTLLTHQGFSFPVALRRAVLAAMLTVVLLVSSSPVHIAYSQQLTSSTDQYTKLDCLQ